MHTIGSVEFEDVCSGYVRVKFDNIVAVVVLSAVLVKSCDGAVGGCLDDPPRKGVVRIVFGITLWIGDSRRECIPAVWCTVATVAYSKGINEFLARVNEPRRPRMVALRDC
ncbi:hypothetical protein [Halococcus sp. AFM35]|uniref:hypothetical protein n=1 Tax=Halococcus sp. AFM35 TaxID=3421653 RepID=UPI003EBC6E7C